MQTFTETRTITTPDEFWVLQHSPIFTQGQAGKPEHLLNPGDTPIIKVDRGGQVTYHGPGQLIIYLLINLKRHHIGVRDLVTLIENSIVNTLSELGITAAPKPNAPGVYTDGQKIASLGLRIRNGCSFHGLALNIDMDLSPFLRINPCGYPDLEMTHVANFVAQPDFPAIEKRLTHYLHNNLGYNEVISHTQLMSQA